MFQSHHPDSCTLLQVAYKRTDWLDDQILVTGFAAGGLTEVPQEQFRTCSMAVTLATELGPFGIKTQVRLVTGLAEEHAPGAILALNLQHQGHSDKGARSC